MDDINELIYFKGFSYPVREIEINDDTVYRVSVKSLEDRLLNDGKYVSEYARIIDESIYYYVDDKEIRLPYEKLRELVYRESGLDYV